jgi:hypothetical protein
MAAVGRAGRMKPRCEWTGARTERAVPVSIQAVNRFGGPAPPRTVCVLPEHEPALRAYADRARRLGRPFFAALMLIMLAMVGVVALSVPDVLTESATLRAIGVLLALMGALMIALPFTTPETQQAFGVRASIRVARVAGAIVIVMGATITLLA